MREDIYIFISPFANGQFRIYPSSQPAGERHPTAPPPHPLNNPRYPYPYHYHNNPRSTNHDGIIQDVLSRIMTYAVDLGLHNIIIKTTYWT